MAEPSQPEPKRRAFLALTVIGAATAATAGAVGFWVRLRREAQRPALSEPVEPMSESGERLAAGVRAQLGSLDIPAATLARWVNLYEQHEGPWRHAQVRRHTVERFLLSTDFFPEADEGRALRFVAYHDPYVSPCHNPLRGS